MLKRIIKIKEGDSAQLLFRVNAAPGSYSFSSVENIHFTGPATIEIEYEEGSESDSYPITAEENGTVD